jgi:MYXO-CTERM domain-containing protein
VLALALLLAGPVLELPWSCDETYARTQGPDGVESHSGFARHAWDFAMPLGTEVVAARSGTVLMIEMGSRVGGCSEVYAHDANYVLIDHQDGTAGLYLHLEGGSSDLAVGDRVAAGDVIARVGQTGWSCGPHLHFQVQVICGSWWCQSLPVTIAQRSCDTATDDPQLSSPIVDPAEPSSRVWLLALLAPLGLGLAWRHRRR